MKTILACLLASALLGAAMGDCYLHNPRGSNNRLNEAADNTANQNRLCDTQNNAAGGYHVTPQMYYYESSILSVSWTNQHASGPTGYNNNNVVIQVMCEANLRDGTPENDASARQTIDVTVGDQDNDNGNRGRHETIEYYNQCRTRQRNRGLFNADQGVNNNVGATGTRQNPGGTRHGAECTEERDQYPYWHWSPWVDMAYLTSNTSHCEMVQRESQNVMDKGGCSSPQHNNQEACEDDGATWTMSGAWGLEPPECLEAPWSRVNHLGNSGETKTFAAQLMWNGTFTNTPPAWREMPCALRIRYNISTDDYDPWNIDSSSNGRDQSPIVNDPQAEIGLPLKLQLAINTAQFGRTFQDRSHAFLIREDPAIPAGGRIFNLNVMGHRGNIVQNYPAVEYDYIPTRLEIEEADLVHIQFAGSNYNNNNRAGQGTAGTDRTNMVQIIGNRQDMNLPEDVSKVTMIPQDDPDRVNKITNLALVGGTDSELNDAPAYYDFGLQSFKNGAYHYMCTRNNNFTNRSQKGQIIVGPQETNFLASPVGTAVIASIAAVAGVSVLGGLVVYARAHPSSGIAKKMAKPGGANTHLPSAGSRGAPSAGARSKGSKGSKRSKKTDFTQASDFTRM